MRTITVQQRRRALVRRHHLTGDAAGAESVTRALLALHATDPASVYLSVLARAATTTLDEVAAAMYDGRSLVRWLAMRGTLFVVDRADVPMIQAAVSTPLAAVLRRRLVSQLDRNGTEPPIDGDLDTWLIDLEDRVAQALAQRGTATGIELSADVPALTTRIAARAPSDRPQRVTTPLLTLMSAQGLLVRATPTGAWTSRHHRWEPATTWWPDGLPVLDEPTAQRELAHRWLRCFGPAAAEDLQWWTGWTKATTTRALRDLPIEPIDLHDGPGIALPGQLDDLDAHDTAISPVAALLPALDPTPMGYRHRHWFFGLDPGLIFDRAGNIGPTLWWDGEIVGSWAVTEAGDVRIAFVADRGRDAHTAAVEAAARLQERLAGAVVTPAARTPLERALTQNELRHRVPPPPG